MEGELVYISPEQTGRMNRPLDYRTDFYLLTEPAEILQDWQTRILNAVGNNGQVIIDVVPDLELIIGEQSPLLYPPADTDLCGRAPSSAGSLADIAVHIRWPAGVGIT